MDLGLTEPNAAGRQYRHGTLSGYTPGGCQCEHCRGAYPTYRAQRRAAGKDRHAPARTTRNRTTLTTDGRIPRSWFRGIIWKPALDSAGIGIRVRTHDLRHAQASWLLAGGADLQTVKERLGHGSIITTEKYLHTLAETDATALTALAAIRQSHRPTWSLVSFDCGVAVRSGTTLIGRWHRRRVPALNRPADAGSPWPVRAHRDAAPAPCRTQLAAALDVNTAARFD